MYFATEADLALQQWYNNYRDIIRSIERVRIDERTGNLYVIAGEDLDLEIKPSGGYEP